LKRVRAMQSISNKSCFGCKYLRVYCTGLYAMCGRRVFNSTWEYSWEKEAKETSACEERNY
jgi:hypothetical protein